MKLTAAVAGLCVMVVMVTAKPSKRFISIHQIEHGLHHIGHEIEHGAHHVGHEIENGAHHVGHEIEHGVNHLGHELEHITGIHTARDLACKLFPFVKSMGVEQCSGACTTAAASSAGVLAPLCPAACNMVVHQADKLVKC